MSLRGAARLLGSLAISFFWCLAALRVDLAPAPVFLVHAPKADPRVKRLGAFFKAHHCPEPHHVADYLRAADQYRLDYRLLPAISVRETSCGWTEKDNNLWGYHPGRQTFESVESGIEFLSRQLAENPPYVGKELNQKLFTYNPRPAYPNEVLRIMRQIE